MFTPTYPRENNIAPKTTAGGLPVETLQAADSVEGLPGITFIPEQEVADSAADSRAFDHLHVHPDVFVLRHLVEPRTLEHPLMRYRGIPEDLHSS